MCADAIIFYLIIIIIWTIILVTVILLYMYLTRHLSVNKIKHYLDMCIKALDNDLKNSLISKEKNSFNFILENYLNTNDEILLTKLARFIAKKYPVNIYSDLTDPANVMCSFMKCICDEQLESTYENGYLLRFINYEELQKRAPFVTNFCFISNSIFNTYVDFICYNPVIPLKYAFFSGVVMLYTKARKYLKFSLISYLKPPKIIFLANKTKVRDYISFYNPDNLTMNTFKDVQYYLCSVIIRGGMDVKGFEQFGGVEFSQEEIQEIRLWYQFYLQDYIAVGVFKRA